MHCHRQTNRRLGRERPSWPQEGFRCWHACPDIHPASRSHVGIIVAKDAVWPTRRIRVPGRVAGDRRYFRILGGAGKGTLPRSNCSLAVGFVFLSPRPHQGFSCRAVGTFVVPHIGGVQLLDVRLLFKRLTLDITASDLRNHLRTTVALCLFNLKEAFVGRNRFSTDSVDVVHALIS